MFIVFEGIDGCGKTTQAKLFAKYLQKEGFQVYLTREPSDNRIGRFFRENYLEKEASWNVLRDVFMFFADRAEHVELEIEPALREGKIVVSDRYYHSSIVYQYVGSLRSRQKLSLKWLLETASLFPKPNLVFIIDVDIETAMSRIENRGKYARYEFREYLSELKGMFLKLPELLRNETIYIVDGIGAVDEVQNRIINSWKSFLKENRELIQARTQSSIS